MILVTGAGGTVGTALVEALKASGHAFRAAHHSPEKTAKAKSHGDDAVRIDFAEPATLPPALEGVDAVFLLGTGLRGQAEGETSLVNATKNSGVKKLVKLSVWRAPEEEYSLAEMHRSVERAIEESGLDWTFLRPNGFMQNFANHMAESIKEKGAIYQPAGDTRISFVDVRDIAAVAAQALTSEGHAGKAYELSGPQALSYREVAGIFTRVLGREVSYVALTDEHARAGMLDAGMPDFYADAMIGLNRAYRDGIAKQVTPDVEDVTGRPPVSFEQFVRDYAHSFR